MRGFARMNEKRRRARRGKGRGDLLADVAALADAGDDDAALDGHQAAHGFIERSGKRSVEILGELGQTLALEVERAHRRGDRRFGVRL